MKKTLLALVVLSFAAFGCRPYNTPTLVGVEPNETAFVLPLDDDPAEQQKFESVDYLKEKQIAAKRIEVPMRWRQTGYLGTEGSYIPAFRVIKVDRAPITRNWNDIQAESAESIGFAVEITVVAQIPESEAATYLYYYREKSLAEVMDQELKSRVNGKLVEYCSGMKLQDIFTQKATIMKNIRDHVLPYFEKRGIDITNLEMQGNLDFEEKAIQESINQVFTAAQRVKATQDENRAAQLKAEGDRKIASLLSGATAIRLKELELKKEELDIQKKAVEKWDGKLPVYSGETGGILGLLKK